MRSRSVVASILLSLTAAACSSSSQGGGSSGADGSATAGGGNNATGPTLTGTWYGVSVKKAHDQWIDMTSTSSGTAVLYWYTGGYSKWVVSADDDGSGKAQLTLTCTNTDCATADPIHYDCTYTLLEMKCLGISGGQDNSYDFANSGRTAPDVYTKDAP